MARVQVRDALYTVVADNRYRWFGTQVRRGGERAFRTAHRLYASAGMVILFMRFRAAIHTASSTVPVAPLQGSFSLRCSFDYCGALTAARVFSTSHSLYGAPKDGACMHACRQSGRQAVRLAGRQAGTQARRQAGTQARRQARRHAGTHACRHAGRQAGRQAGRPTDRQTDRH
jgi:hypothetical protein